MVTSPRQPYELTTSTPLDIDAPREPERESLKERATDMSLESLSALPSAAERTPSQIASARSIKSPRQIVEELGLVDEKTELLRESIATGLLEKYEQSALLHQVPPIPHVKVEQPTPYVHRKGQSLNQSLAIPCGAVENSQYRTYPKALLLRATIPTNSKSSILGYVQGVPYGRD